MLAGRMNKADAIDLKSSQRQAYRSAERAGEKKNDSDVEDSDDDLIDLAVL